MLKFEKKKIRRQKVNGVEHRRHKVTVQTVHETLNDISPKSEAVIFNSESKPLNALVCKIPIICLHTHTHIYICGLISKHLLLMKKYKIIIYCNVMLAFV